MRPDKLAAWTKSPPTIEPIVGGKVVLFQGNVRGEFLTLNEGKEIEQTWRLPTWPEGKKPCLNFVDCRTLLQFENCIRSGNGDNDTSGDVVRSSNWRRGCYEAQFP